MKNLWASQGLHASPAARACVHSLVVLEQYLAGVRLKAAEVLEEAPPAASRGGCIAPVRRAAVDDEISWAYISSCALATFRGSQARLHVNEFRAGNVETGHQYSSPNHYSPKRSWPIPSYPVRNSRMTTTTN